MKPKKSLGQHFLTNPAIVAKIADAAQIVPDERVIEIGPGKGILTRTLLERGARVIAIEKDEALALALRSAFHGEIESKKLTVITGDVLDVSLESLVDETPYKLVANIPYYITGAILRKFLEGSHTPYSMTVLVQKEVAERIVARDGKESLLSISVKVYGAPKIAGNVKAGSFTPAPKVDSAILTVSQISKNNFSNTNEKRFFEILRAGFSHKRKILARNLESVLPRGEIERAFATCKLDQKIRAEDLKTGDWICISELLQRTRTA